jgi:hypothetical protein
MGFKTIWSASRDWNLIKGFINDDFPTCGPYWICYLKDEDGYTY